MIGYLMQPFTPRKRALHDFVSGTVVVVQAPYSRALVGAMIGVMVLLILMAVVAGVMVPAYQDYVIRRGG
jgi:amino acid transporter